MTNSTHAGKDASAHQHNSPDEASQINQTPDRLTRALEALSQREQRHAFLLQMSDTLRPLVDPQLILKEAARVLGQFLGANRVGYAETQSDPQLVAVTRNFTQGVSSIEGIYRYQDYGPDLLHSMQRGQTVVRHDIAHDPTLTDSEKQAHALLQLGASLNVPLVKQGHLVAILFVHYQQAHIFSTDEVALAQETAERTWAYLEQARSEAALRESQQQLSAIVNQASVGIARTNPDGTFTFVNEQYSKQLGYESADLLGRRMQEFTHPADLTRNLELFHRLDRYGEPFEIEKRYVRKDGSLIWVHNHVSAIRNAVGEISQLMAVSVNITGRKEAELALATSEARYRALAGELEERVQVRTQELLQANQELKRSNENLQQFAYVASHDLQEPLRKIQAFGDLLKGRQGALSRDEIGYIERMQSAASRMGILIRDLLAFSRFSIQSASEERVALKEVVEQVLSTLELVIAETKAKIEISPLPTVQGDATQLTQLFQNLLGNALKFHQPSVAPLIHIRSHTLEAGELPATVKPRRASKVYYQIDVVDNGVGFDVKYVDRIFQVFQRLHGRSQYTGTGIGLAICERVVANHGGTITANSQPGQGSIFTIYLPGAR